MNLVFILFIAALITISTSALSCPDTKASIVIALDDFSPDNFTKLFDKLDWKNGNGKCFVDILFNHQKFEMLTMLFGSTMNSDSFDTHLHIHMESNMELGKVGVDVDSANIRNKIRVTWDTVDFINDFVLGGYDWLINMEYSDLLSTLNLLLINNDQKTDKCTTDQQSQVQLCPVGMCHFEYVMSTNYTRQQCGNDLNGKPTFSLVTDFIVQVGKHQERIGKVNFTINYWCSSDGCNNMTVAHKVIKAVKENYNFLDLQNMLDLVYASYWFAQKNKM